jgi:hypothetical protein
MADVARVSVIDGRDGQTKECTTSDRQESGSPDSAT